MKRFLTTTALVAALAMPAFAQQSDSSRNAINAEANQMDPSAIMVTDLIDMRIYMPRESGGLNGETNAASKETETATSTETEEPMENGDASTETADAGDVDGPVENEIEEAGRDVANAANEAGQAIENTAEEAGQEIAEAANEAGEAFENAAKDAEAELTGEFTDVPDNWEMVGEIEDLIITPDGQVRALLVDAGGFLGIGETEKRVELSNVRFIRDADDEGEYFVVFNGDRSMFESQDSYDAQQAQAQGEMRASETDAMASLNEQRRMEQEQAETLDWANLTTEDVLGAAVYGENDEWIGDLSEFSLAENGKIESVIIDVGGFLGIGEKPVSMPLSEIELKKVRGDEVRAYVKATEEELENMDEWTGADM